MVRKLYKHEFAALFKWVIPLNLICLLLSLLTKLNTVIAENSPFEIVTVIVAIAYGISLVSLVAITFVVVVSRFYKNLLSQEGYLTFTIPISPITHIVCKLICGSIAVMVSCIIAGLSLGVIVSSTLESAGVSAVFSEMVGIFTDIIGFEMEYIATPRLVMLIVSYCITAVVTVMSGILFTYAAMALGQRSRKNRVASAVGWYFLIYIGRSIITSIYESIISALSNGGDDSVFTVAERTMQYVDALQVSTVINMIDGLVWGALFFLITWHILTKKLNLE